jgi:hypothetical protein
MNMPGQVCCFCRRIEVLPLEENLAICRDCARHTHTSTFGPGGQPGTLRLVHDGGRSINVETYLDFSPTDEALLWARARKLDEALERAALVR